MLAFLRREIATYVSYRAKVSLGLASMALSLVTFTFVGKVVASSGTGFSDRFGMSYTSFAIVGIFVHSLASSGLHSFRSAVRREQLQGTLEVLLAAGLPAPLTVLVSGLSEVLLRAAVGAVLMVVVAAVAGVALPLTPALLSATLLYLCITTGAGLASAGFVLVSKEGDPISWVFGGAAGLLGGVFFPVEMLPSWLRAAARLLPTTHALAVARAGLPHAGVASARAIALSGVPAGSGATLSASAGSIVYLCAAAPVSLAVGLVALRWGLSRARRDGTLGHY
ncbi:MAG: ABC transporter permease [Candidatus Eisenbacteria bacterium]|nr:ABC transporter permease [Candidatus Eisenbacteria bacterium]